jgi:hypothetical protein
MMIHTNRNMFGKCNKHELQLFMAVFNGLTNVKDVFTVWPERLNAIFILPNHFSTQTDFAKCAHFICCHIIVFPSYLTIFSGDSFSDLLALC